VKAVSLEVDPLLAALSGGVRVFDLARPMVIGMAQSPNHPQYRLSMPRRHGDRVRADGGSAANDLLETGTHVGTHIDALGHVSHCGQLHGGLDAAEVQASGRLSECGVEEIPPIVTRGVLLDIAAVRGVESLEGGTEVTIDDLEAASERAGGINEGDVALVRTGWGRWWEHPEAYVGAETGVPGVSEAGARWLAARRPVAVGGDSIAFECLAPGAGHALLPAHRVLLVESGVFIMETMALEELAAANVTEFLFVVAPLPLVGATGSPVRPLAVVRSAVPT
jgi:kynurenine formamidase